MVNADFWSDEEGGFWGEEARRPGRRGHGAPPATGRSPHPPAAPARTGAARVAPARPAARSAAARPAARPAPARPLPARPGPVRPGPTRPDADRPDTARPGADRRSSQATTVDLPVQAKPASRRSGRKRRSSGLVTALAVLILVASLGGGGYFGYLEVRDRFGAPDYSGQGTGSVTIEVAVGEYTSHVGETLVEADVVKSVKAFVQAAGDQLKGLQPGFYDMRKQMSAAAAVALLLDPKSRTGIVDVPPGKWAAEVYAQLSKATGIPVGKFERVDARTLGLPAAAKGNVEGYLFPGRYDLPPDATAQQLLKMMVTRFKEETEDIDFDKGAKLGLTPSEVVTMASLIQAEAGRPGDYRKISRVLYNRLEIDMPIQFDTAILYAWQKRTLDVRNRHLEIDSPYNLYQNKGLPPGPIGSPGVTALKAVLNPAPGPWIFFVATNPTKRITKFTDDPEEFDKFKAEFNQWLEDNPQPKD
ncbi:endolytic transglycosylase MltG [Actinocorallia populi]|uniref:endolytic transglycosylase MltG n=1 Tax=Actinocorallia populi TaxID=2079200 RepID=UPI000D0924D8|nr:endolytic transglycosylase MltG [Actinocorallia populi]